MYVLRTIGTLSLRLKAFANANLSFAACSNACVQVPCMLRFAYIALQM